MRRLTRKIGLFGGPAALMPAMGVKKPPPKKEPAAAATPADAPAAQGAPAERKSWFRRFWRSDDKK